MGGQRTYGWMGRMVGGLAGRKVEWEGVRRPSEEGDGTIYGYVDLGREGGIWIDWWVDEWLDG